MVPMHAKKRKGALHEPWLVWSPAFRRLEWLGPAEAGTPSCQRFHGPNACAQAKGGSPWTTPRAHRKRRNTCDALDCAGKAQRRRRFGSTSDGCGNAEFMLALFAEPKAAWRFASRRTLQDAGAFATVARTSAMLWSARPQQAPFSGVSTNEGADQILIFRTHCWLASQYVRFILISGSSPEGCTRPSASSARD